MQHRIANSSEETEKQAKCLRLPRAVDLNLPNAVTFNTVICVVVTPDHKIILLLLHTYNFTVVMNCNVNIGDIYVYIYTYIFTKSDLELVSTFYNLHLQQISI